MTRGQVPEVAIVKDKEKPTIVTLEERIIAARDEFLSERSQDVERMVTESLEQNYSDLLYATIGVRENHFGRGYEFYISDDTEFARTLQGMAKQRAREILEKLDFGKVELNNGQVHAIRAAYQAELKSVISDAARSVAQQDAEKVVRKVLNLPEEE